MLLAQHIDPVREMDSALAKGASDEETAAAFDRIDRMLGYYSTVAGYGAPDGVSIAFGGLVGLKKEENKLWCFSTIMMGYVGDAIGENGQNTIFARSPEEAKARAAKLCKLKYDPADFARQAAKAAAAEAASGWFDDVKSGLRKEALSKAYEDWKYARESSRIDAHKRLPNQTALDWEVPFAVPFHDYFAAAVNRGAR